MKRTTYRLTVRAEPGVDEIRALRSWLKQSLRLFGLKCLQITPGNEEKMMVDARKFAPKQIKPEHVKAPIQSRIIAVLEDERYDRLLLELENGSQFALNQTNTAILIKAWGHDTDAWIKLELELALGTYKDWNDDPPTEKPTVRVRAISPAPAGQNGSAPASKPLPPSRAVASTKDMDDEIPF